eukprot:TRINITY_DN69311_c0_g1_i1.p1 TRINITY_DN69311_c0_g1~~TRINITY_DN69311_c0_g1_i1.p1  ORF type:complete len:644 (+),score=58.56 TRINITY_DN69311_c0_g1_i1:98-1933(+)
MAGLIPFGSVMSEAAAGVVGVIVETGLGTLTENIPCDAATANTPTNAQLLTAIQQLQKSLDALVATAVNQAAFPSSIETVRGAMISTFAVWQARLDDGTLDSWIATNNITVTRDNLVKLLNLYAFNTPSPFENVATLIPSAHTDKSHSEMYYYLALAQNAMQPIVYGATILGSVLVNHPNGGTLGCLTNCSTSTTLATCSTLGCGTGASSFTNNIVTAQNRICAAAKAAGLSNKAISGTSGRWSNDGELFYNDGTWGADGVRNVPGGPSALHHGMEIQTGEFYMCVQGAYIVAVKLITKGTNNKRLGLEVTCAFYIGGEFKNPYIAPAAHNPFYPWVIKLGQTSFTHLTDDELLNILLPNPLGANNGNGNNVLIGIMWSIRGSAQIGDVNMWQVMMDFNLAVAPDPRGLPADPTARRWLWPTTGWMHADATVKGVKVKARGSPAISGGKSQETGTFGAWYDWGSCLGPVLANGKPGCVSDGMPTPTPDKVSTTYSSFLETYVATPLAATWNGYWTHVMTKVGTSRSGWRAWYLTHVFTSSAVGSTMQDKGPFVPLTNFGMQLDSSATWRLVATDAPDAAVANCQKTPPNGCPWDKLPFPSGGLDTSQVCPW